MGIFSILGGALVVAGGILIGLSIPSNLSEIYAGITFLGLGIVFIVIAVKRGELDAPSR